MYVKVFASILTSTLWALDDATRLVWITLLALSDRDGFVRASPSGLARLANVEEEKGRHAIVTLSSPDKDSASQEFEGRRIECVPGGFIILNYAKYRDLKDAESRREQVRAAVQRHRAKKSHVITGKRRKAHADAVTDVDVKAPASGVEKRVVVVPPTAKTRSSIDENGTANDTTEAFMAQCYADESAARQLDVRRQLRAVLNSGCKFNGSLVHAFDQAHLDRTLREVMALTLADSNAAIVIVLKKLTETYLEVKSTAEKAEERT